MQSPFGEEGARFRGPLLAGLLLAVACGPARREEPPAGQPYVLVLGTAQDGGLPQIGCEGPHCSAARRDPARRRLVTSLLLCDPRSGRRWLFDASPDLPLQVERGRGHPPTRTVKGPRPPLFDGVFLTHAHTGHYTGLLHLSREAYGARGLNTFGSARMVEFLKGSGPWSLMLSSGQLIPQPIEPGVPVALAPDLSVVAVPVPHRDEYTDTFAFHIRGPHRALLYLPDIDKWELWDQSVESWIQRSDYALLDGSFFGDGEIPGRSMEDIPHPFICESLQRFSALSADLLSRVYFTHLNHTNPATQPYSAAARRIRASGAHVAADEQRFDL